MDDIRPPAEPQAEPLQNREQLVAAMQAEKPHELSEPLGKAPRRRLRRWPMILALFMFGVVVACGALYGWYVSQLAAVTTDRNARTVRVTIESGQTPDQIAALLADKQLIRSAQAFRLYTKLSKTENHLQAGSYSLTPNQTVPVIVEHLTSGKSDELEITFVPGATLRQNRKVLIDAGYTEQAVDAALAKTYDHPLFASKPATADLEGYLYGETHRFAFGTPVETVLTRYFDDFYEVIKKNNLVEGYAAQGLNLYEGITLASIIQRESGGNDKPQIAQVFLLRLEKGIQLGSDVTYQYIADKKGVTRSTTLDDPYNTRLYTGLPPGPIATPGDDALKAVARPAPGDYLYFLSGDDDVTYYARTEAEHQQNIRDHCQQKCQII